MNGIRKQILKNIYQKNLIDYLPSHEALSVQADSHIMQTNEKGQILELNLLR